MDNVVEAVLLNFIADSPCSLCVEFEAAYLAEAPAFLARWLRLCLRLQFNGWITVENRSCRRVRERAASCSCFDDGTPRPHAQSVQDIAVVRGIHDLRPMRERRSPRLGRGIQQMTEPTRGSDGRLWQSTLLIPIFIVVHALQFARFALELLRRWSAPSGARVDFGCDDLCSPWLIEECTVRVRAESSRCDFAFFVALVLVVVDLQDGWDCMVSAEVEEGEAIRLRPSAGY